MAASSKPIKVLFIIAPRVAETRESADIDHFHSEEARIHQGLAALSGAVGDLSSYPLDEPLVVLGLLLAGEGQLEQI